MPSDEPPQYQVAHLRQVLAEDPRTSELGVRVAMRGDTIHLTGDVTCAQRRDDIVALAEEVMPDHKVCADIRVTEAGEPAGREELR